MQMESAHSSTWLGIKWVPKEKKITQVTTARTASSLPFAHWSESHNKSHGLTGGRSWETSRVGMFPPSLAWGYSLRTLHRGSRARAPPLPSKPRSKLLNSSSRGGLRAVETPAGTPAGRPCESHLYASPCHALMQAPPAHLPREPKKLERPAPPLFVSCS